VGFQLSYIALFFIIWLQPLLASIWPKQALEIYLGILTVSFAQIGTMPLSIYYFHQFQVYFSSRTSQSSVAKFYNDTRYLVVLASFNYVPLFLSKPLGGVSTISTR
jgi:competence protein ComEC